jgi:hypothetical protein
VPRIVHVEELVFEHADQLLGFCIGIFLMGLHCQEKGVSLLGPGVVCDLGDGLRKQVDRLFAVGKHEDVDEVLG